MFALSSAEKIQHNDVEMNKENGPATSEAALKAPTETNTGSNQSVFDMPPPTSEDASPGAKDSGIQPGPGHSTISKVLNEAEVLDDDVYPAVRKRKRNSVRGDYLAADVANESELDSPANKKPGGIWNSRQGLTWKGHEVKHGVPIGVWKLSDEPIEERKHVLYGFLDPRSVLHARKYPERKDGTRYQGNFPSGTGSWAAKTDTWLLDPHLKSLSKKELAEYVRVRVGTWKPDERPKERDALNARAVADAKVAAAAAERLGNTEGKENGARKAKSSKYRISNQGNLDTSTPQRSCGEPSPSHPSLVNSTKKASQQGFTSPSSAPTRTSIPTSNGTRLAKRDSREPHLAPPLRKSQRLSSIASSQPATPTRDSSKYVIKGKDILIGYWKESCEPEPINKHAIYDVIQANNVFRVKVVPETRDGRPVKGNYPSLQGGCWVNYDSCVLQLYLKDLMRMEIEEYCRFCIADPDYNDGHQGAAIERARIAAKKKVADDAAAMRLNVEYNRKKCDQRDQGAIARAIERQKKTGEIVDTCPKTKVEAKPTAIRSNKAKSDAIAQRLKLERKEAIERATANSRVDAELAEAMRQSAQEQVTLEPQQEPGQNADALPATETGIFNNTTAATPGSEPTKEMLSANGDFRQNSNTSFSDVNTTNSSEHNSQVKFHLLDREAQRAKMERWCQRKPTSQYHTLDREGQKRHVEKHIDQLILRQTGSSKAHRPKKQPGTEGLSSASPAQPGVVSAPSSLADVMDVISTSKTVVQSPRSTSNMQITTAAAGEKLSDNPGPVNHTTATPVAPEVAAVSSSSYTVPPTVQWDTSLEPSAGNIGTNLSAEPLPNATLASLTSECALAPQPEHGENGEPDVLRAPAPSAQKYPSILEELARILRSELQRDGPTQFPTQFLTQLQTPVPPANSYFTQPAGFNAPPQAAMGKQTVQSEQYAGAQHQPEISQQAYSTPQAAIENQTLQSEQYARTQQQSQIGEYAYSSPRDFWNLSERSPGLQSGPCNTAATQFIAPYPTPSSLNGSDPDIKATPRQPTQPQQYPDLNSIPTSPKLSSRLTSHPPAPEIKEGDDGIKYRIRPGSKFSSLFVSLNREVVHIDNADHIKQHVLMPMQDSLPSLQQAPELVSDVDGVEYRMALNGLFEGYLVGTRRTVIALDWDVDYMKFVVLVPV